MYDNISHIYRSPLVTGTQLQPLMPHIWRLQLKVTTEQTSQSQKIFEHFPTWTPYAHHMGSVFLVVGVNLGKNKIIYKYRKV